MEAVRDGDPREVGPYRVLARLGAGGMGQVFLARSPRGRNVAVRVIRPDLAEQEEFRVRFRWEAEAAWRVEGVWTSLVLDAAPDAERPWMATVYAPGPALATLPGPLPERSVRILAAALASALREIHAAGLAHRALHPGNILLTHDGPGTPDASDSPDNPDGHYGHGGHGGHGGLRVVDVGLARALDTVTEGGLTRTGARGGSPASLCFLAPEQVRHDRVTEACDLFSLGAVLCYAATGAAPFGGADDGASALMFRIAQEEPDLTQVPEALRELVRDCLAKDPALRPSPDEILDRSGARDALSDDGKVHEPWLPDAIRTEAAEHARRLLDLEPTGYGHPAGNGAPPGGKEVPPVDNTVGPGTFVREVRLGPPGPAFDAGTWLADPPPYGTAPPHDTTPQSYDATTAPPPRRSRRFTALLITLAAAVAFGAGGSLYAMLNGDGKQPDQDDEHPAPTSTPTSAPTTVRTPPRTPMAPEGDVPRRFLGTWTARFSAGGDGGTNTRVLSLVQGAEGDVVMTLAGQGPTHDCSWTARLRSTGGRTLLLGPSTVVRGEPDRCRPGSESRLTVGAEGRTLVRELTGTNGAPLTYKKSSD